jgi:hypothetical protein
MSEILGTDLAVFVVVTLGIIGFAAFMTGQALANTWRPWWQVVPYVLLLGCADRFLIWGLFGGELFLLSGYIVDTLVLLIIAGTAFRATQVGRMVAQYPWLYERSGPLSYRRKA